MKRTKNFLKLGLVATVLILGVGYATLTSQTLTINGKATQVDTPIDVQFTEAGTPTITDVSNRNSHPLTATAAIDSTDATNRTATFDISNLEEKGDKVVIVYTVKNYSTDTAAKVYATTDATISDSALSVTVDRDSLANAATVAADGTATITVTAELTSTLTSSFSSDTSAPETVTITLTADPVQ